MSATNEYNKFDFGCLILGLKGFGKSTRAKQRALQAARGEHPVAGVKMRVFVHDPTESWIDVAETFESPRAWATAVAKGGLQPYVIRFLQIDARALCELATATSKASAYHVPALFVFDEGKRVSDLKENYIAPWFVEFDAIRRHQRTGWIFNAQDGAVHEDLISSASEIDCFNLVNTDDLKRLSKKASVPQGILEGIPRLEKLQFGTGMPSSPSSWR